MIPRPFRQILWLAFALSLLVQGTIWLTGCTIAPKPVQASAVSFSGNKQDSGLVGRLADGGYEVTAAAVVRYESLIDQGYGKPFTPPLKRGDGISNLPNGDYEIDDEHLVDFGVMATAKRSGRTP